jgi:hypothetical protein
MADKPDKKADSSKGQLLIYIPRKESGLSRVGVYHLGSSNEGMVHPRNNGRSTEGKWYECFHV